MTATKFLIVASCALGVLCITQISTAVELSPVEAARQKAQEEAAAGAKAQDEKADALIPQVQAAISQNAPIEAYDKFLEQLSAISQPAAYGQSSKVAALRSFITHWQDYLHATNKGDLQSAMQTMRQLTQEAVGLPILPRSTLLGYQDQIAARIVDADNAVLNPLLTQLDKIFDDSTNASDFDNLFGQIADAEAKTTQLQPSQSNNLVRKLQELGRFVSQWQEYLTLCQNGRMPEAQNTLRALANDSSYGSSELAAKYRARIRTRIAKSPTPPPDTLRPEELTLMLIDRFAKEVSALEAAGGRYDHPNLGSSISRLVLARNQIDARQFLPAIKALDFAHPESYTNQTGRFAANIETIRQSLLNQALAGHLQPKLKPTPFENPRDFLFRVVRSQINAKDYAGAYQTLQLKEMLEGTSPLAQNSDAAPFQAIIEAENEEAAGQYAQAQKAYERALKSPSPLVPVFDISYRLNKLKAAHPTELPGPGINPKQPRDPADPVSVTTSAKAQKQAPKPNPGQVMSDAWQMLYFHHLKVAPNEDPDEDGLTNQQEFERGTDPTDYFNGEVPIITPLPEGNRSTGEYIVKVTRPDGTPYANAPVTFGVPADTAQLAGNPDSTITTQEIRTRTDEMGLARVYLRPPAQKN